MTDHVVATTHTDESGASHFGTTVIDLEASDFAPPAPPFAVSTPVAAERVIWFSVPVGWTGDWHPAPHDQLYIQSSGQLEVTVSDGEIRVLSAGNVLWTRDTFGIGHRSRVVGDQPAVGLFVQLRSEAVPS